MEPTRRHFLLGSLGATVVAAASTFFPEFARATAPAKSSPSSNSAIAIAQASPSVKKYLHSYQGYTFDWANAQAIGDAQTAWVTVTGTKKNGDLHYGTALRVAVDIAGSAVLFTQKVETYQAAAGSDTYAVKVFADNKLVWQGTVDQSKVSPDAGYPASAGDVAIPDQTCRYVVGILCEAHSAADCFFLAAIFGLDTGGIGMGVAAICAVIFWLGCAQAESAICG